MPKNTVVLTADMVSELLEQKQFTHLYTLLKEMRAEDIAPLFENLEPTDAVRLFRLLPKTLAADTFVELDATQQEDLIARFSDRELKAVLDDMFVDDTVDVIEEMPANVVKRIIQQSDEETRQSINEILDYPKDSAGSIMTTEFVSLHPDFTVTDAFARIRQTGVEKETIYTCYITDSNRHLLGVVSVLKLLLAEWDTTLRELMDTHVISVSTHDDKEIAANRLNKYGFMALPVVDGENRLVGIVTFDDAIDVLTEEATEDIEKMAAIVPTDKPYMRTGIFETFRKRIPWLLILMISATFTGAIISHFEETIAAIVGGSALIAFIPMLMDTGGNAGSQSSVTVVRGLALGEIRFSDFFRILWRECRVAMLCGIVLAVCNFVKVLLIDKLLLGNQSITPLIALVVCMTLFVTVLAAKIVGCILPLTAQKLGFDPAVMASPFITTIVDALALLVYFQIATIVLL